MNRRLSLTLAILFGVIALVLPAFAGDYPLQVARNIMMYMALAVTWDMLIRSGQVSFGIAGLFGLGAYATILSVVHANFPPILSILFGAAFAGLVAFFIGFLILRLRAIYFSIVTLALSSIFMIVMQNLVEFTGGPQGLIIQQGIIFNGNTHMLYWRTLAGLAVALAASIWFEKSKIHFALTAIRNNEVSAKSSGVNIFRWLLLAFVVTSTIQGLLGGIFVQEYAFATPDSVFSADFTLLPLGMALLGGTYSTTGPIIGAVLLGLVSEWLKMKIPYGHLVVYGVMIIVVILFMPQGLKNMLKPASNTTERGGA